MAKMTKAIVNDRKIIGVVWDSNGKEVITLDQDISIDLNKGITVRNTENYEEVFIDLIDLVSNAINELNK